MLQIYFSPFFLVHKINLSLQSRMLLNGSGNTFLYYFFININKVFIYVILVFVSLKSLHNLEKRVKYPNIIPKSLMFLPVIQILLCTLHAINQNIKYLYKMSTSFIQKEMLNIKLIHIIIKFEVRSFD